MNSDADEAPEKPIRPEADKVLLPSVSVESSGSKRGAVESRIEEQDEEVAKELENRIKACLPDLEDPIRICLPDLGNQTKACLPDWGSQTKVCL